MNIVSFSGGKDSTAMLLMMIEHGITIDRIINIDTTKEFPAMYKHIDKVRKYVYPLKIETYKIDFDYWFSKHVRTRGKYKGVGGGYGFPDMRNRWCTGLKRQAIRKVLPKEYTDFQGIALNELKRIYKNQSNNKSAVKYPLIEWNITEKQALQYCYAKGFDFGGLYNHFNHVSCWCCPFSNLSELRNLYKFYPELWKKLEIMESKSFRQFKPTTSVQDLEKRFNREDKQMKLF